MSRVLALVSVALLLVGALLGLLPMSVSGMNCGSAFVAPDDSTTMSDACVDARSGRLTPALILLVLGGVGTIGALWVYQAERPGA